MLRRPPRSTRPDTLFPHRPCFRPPYRHLGIEPPPLHLLINRVHPVSANARLIQQALRDLFQDHAGIRVLTTDVPAIEAYPRAATRGLPVHRVEYRQPPRSEEHTSELQSLMRISYAVFCLKKK